GAGTLRTLAINNSSNFTYSGGILNDTGQLALIKSGGGNQILSGSSNFTGGTTVSAGALTIANVNAIGNGSLDVTGGIAQFSAGLATPLLASIATSGGGKIDLADDDLVIDYAGATPISSIASQIASAY